ncbi:MAG: NAD(P)H dehydrogenase, partial [Rubrobacter sp.]|nr:NAD(P)H dehydrogenase [Rubrobacter sp.]
IVVTPGYTDPVLFEAGGNPYGASSTEEPNEQELAAARYLGHRVAEKAALLTGIRV